MLSSRKGLHGYSLLSCYHSKHQLTGVLKTTSVWWFGSECWDALGCFWRELGDSFKWEINRCIIPLSIWSCSLQSCFKISILYQALGTWILVGLDFFMTWSLMKKLIFSHMSSTFWARLLREGLKELPSFLLPHFKKFEAQRHSLIGKWVPSS